MKILSSVSELSAGEGFSIVLLSGLQAFGALALIVGVLIIMDKVYKKKHPDWENKINETEKNINEEALLSEEEEE